MRSRWNIGFKGDECCGVSRYPVIISLENNCQQPKSVRKVATILQEKLGDMLLKDREMSKAGSTLRPMSMTKGLRPRRASSSTGSS